jgi:hypothetical protein
MKKTKLSTGAEKELEGKLRYDLLPSEWEKLLAEVLTMGAEKYSDNNWVKGIPASVSYAAARRHLAQWWSGVDLDEESKLHHLGHACWHLLTQYSFYLKQRKDLDDRPFKEAKK